MEELLRHLAQASPDCTPASAHEVSEAELALGFALPPLLRRLYLEVDNGRLGPPGHPLFSVQTAARLYGDYRADRERGLPLWPAGLLPLCGWGCGIVSCLDCAGADGPVVRVDPNLTVPSMRDLFVLPPGFPFFAAYSNDEIASWVEAPSLASWVGQWLAGWDLFHGGYPEYQPVARAAPGAA